MANTPKPNAPDFTGASSRAGYGQNQFAGASSDTPNQKTESSLAAELRGRQTGLDAIIEKGAKHRDDPSVFDNRGGKKTPATARGMRDANSGGAPAGTVPGPGRPSSKRI